MLTVDEIKSKKASGDMVHVAKILRTTPDVVRQSLNRPGSIRHDSVKAAFTKLLADREVLNSK